MATDNLTYEERKRRAEEQRKKDNQRTLNDYKLAKGNSHANSTPNPTSSGYVPTAIPPVAKQGEFADVLDFAAAKAKRDRK
jgi:hypothetical protein